METKVDLMSRGLKKERVDGNLIDSSSREILRCEDVVESKEPLEESGRHL